MHICHTHLEMVSAFFFPMNNKMNAEICLLPPHTNPLQPKPHPSLSENQGITHLNAMPGRGGANEARTGIPDLLGQKKAWRHLKGCKKPLNGMSELKRSLGFQKT